MFRIVFDPNTALWVIELSGIFGWKLVRNLNFPTLAEAEDYVTRVGLDKAYTRKSATPPMRMVGEIGGSRVEVPAKIYSQQYIVNNARPTLC